MLQMRARHQARQQARLAGHTWISNAWVGCPGPGPGARLRQVNAQQPGGGRGQPAPPSPRAAAPIDLTGYWVSVVNEDWRWRMVTPPKGDYASVPMTDEARKVADAWDVVEGRPLRGLRRRRR